MQKQSAVLIVADKPLTCQYLAGIMEEYGFIAFSALSADKAIETIGPHIDILLTDLNLRGKDGLSLIQEVAALYPHIQTILYAGRGARLADVDAMAAGTVDHYVDPQNSAGLRNSIRRCLEKIHFHKELCNYQNQLEELMEEIAHTLINEKKEVSELNITLNVLIKKIQRDKEETKKKIMANVRDLISPYVQKLERTRLDERQKLFLAVMKKNIEEITSPFIGQLSFRDFNLSPSEIKVANLACQGCSIKETAEIMNLAPDTIKNHRKTIRKKLGIAKTAKSLQTALLAYTKSKREH